MSATERLQKILAASPKVLARIDAVLDGDTTTPRKEPNVKTCTFVEAAKRLNVSRPTIYRLCKDGRLKTVKLNGVSRILLESLFDLAENGGKA